MNVHVYDSLCSHLRENNINYLGTCLGRSCLALEKRGRLFY